MNETPFSSPHFTTCLLRRIYNSSVKNPAEALDLSKPAVKESLVEFVRNLDKDDVSSAIFKAIHAPGSLDEPVEFPQDLIEGVSEILAQKFSDDHHSSKR